MFCIDCFLTKCSVSIFMWVYINRTLNVAVIWPNITLITISFTFIKIVSLIFWTMWCVILYTVMWLKKCVYNGFIEKQMAENKQVCIECLLHCVFVVSCYWNITNNNNKKPIQWKWYVGCTALCQTQKYTREFFFLQILVSILHFKWASWQTDMNLLFFLLVNYSHLGYGKETR